MTKIYNGNDNYTIHLSSGKCIELTQEELDDLQTECVSIKKYNDLLSTVNKLKINFEDLDNIVGDNIKLFNDNIKDNLIELFNRTEKYFKQTIK